MNRRDFLRGRFGGQKDAHRPPGALSEKEFLSACTRCSACIDACPEHIIVKGSGKFPELDFSKGGCTFCGECTSSCPDGALLHFDPDTFAWDLIAVIKDTCLSRSAVTCRVCGDACEVEAIQFSLKTGGISEPVVDTDNCTGCGQCVAVCPVQAISITRKPLSSTVGDEPCQSSISAAC